MSFESKYMSSKRQARTLFLTAGSSSAEITDVATAESALSGADDKQEFAIVEGTWLHS